MGPVHYLSYAFTYLVAAAASEKIAFLKQRKAQFLLHRKATILSCLLHWLLGILQEFHKRKHTQKTDPHLRSTVICMHIFGTQMCASYCYCPWSTIRKNNEKFVESNCKCTTSLICLKNHSPSFGGNCIYTLRMIIWHPEANFI